MGLAYRVALLLSGIAVVPAAHAAPGAQVRTQAAVEIRESAAVSVLGDAPFRLLVSGGTSSAFIVSVAQDRSRVAYVDGTDRSRSNISMVGASSAWGITQDNEILSVSVGFVSSSEHPGSSAHQQRIPLVLAQFN